MVHSAARLATQATSSRTNNGDSAQGDAAPAYTSPPAASRPTTLTRRIQTLESTIWDHLRTENRQTCIAQLDHAWGGRSWLPPWPSAEGKTYSVENLPSTDIFNLASVTRVCVRNQISLPSLWKPGGVMYEIAGGASATLVWTEKLSVQAIIECGKRYGFALKPTTDHHNPTNDSQSKHTEISRSSPKSGTSSNAGDQRNHLLLSADKTTPITRPTTQEEEPAASLYSKAMSQLQSGQSLSDDSIELIQKLVTKHARSTRPRRDLDQCLLLDPLFLDISQPLPQPPQQISRRAYRYIYAPLYHKSPGHWTLARFDLQSSRISWYDPLPQSDGVRYRAVASALCPWLGGVLKPYKLEQLMRPLQTDNSSCGVYILYMYYCLLGSIIIPFTLGHEEARKFLIRLVSEAESLGKSECTATTAPVPTINLEGSQKRRRRSHVPGLSENVDLEGNPTQGSQKRQRVGKDASDLSPSNRFDPTRAQATDIKAVSLEISRLQDALSSFRGSYEDCLTVNHPEVSVLESQLASAETNLNNLHADKSQADEEIRLARAALQALFDGNPTAARRYNTLRPMLETILPGGAVSEARDVLSQGDVEVHRVIEDVSRMAQAALNNVLGSQSTGPLHELEERVRAAEQKQKELSRSLKVSQQKSDELKAKIELEMERKRLKDTLVRLITIL